MSEYGAAAFDLNATQDFCAYLLVLVARRHAR